MYAMFRQKIVCLRGYIRRCKVEQSVLMATATSQPGVLRSAVRWTYTTWRPEPEVHRGWCEARRGRSIDYRAYQRYLNETRAKGYAAAAQLVPMPDDVDGRGDR